MGVADSVQDLVSDLPVELVKTPVLDLPLELVEMPVPNLPVGPVEMKEGWSAASKFLGQVACQQVLMLGLAVAAVGGGHHWGTTCLCHSVQLGLWR